LSKTVKEPLTAADRTIDEGATSAQACPALDPLGGIMNNRPGPSHAGPGTVFAARVILLLTISFLLATGGIAALMALGLHPLAVR